MPDSFTEAVERIIKGRGAEFDPEGTGYDELTAEELRQLAPLPAMSKPTWRGDVGDEVVYTDPKTGETSFEAWVWHPKTEREEEGWYVHGSSRDPRTGQLLKGRKHRTWKQLEEREAELGNIIYKDPGSGRYYSSKSEK
jgi:hypothetical protein|tara:strand:+ start:191 stop:607 length:417 start_codon:yes stop_codon:yes gene_type:complete